ncbi:ABC transporter permease/M1 family aminopeptidase [Aquimarina sp. 2201CG5-10]|uniref:ABC transporter permease/M1 family aminopeptidase n=1 Tax=Aquimarina callyspongiae TaxID=3098150 RepID=UPI002AB36D26|nr:M1 family aminopeptidase [Aquimarina sp. 2201CG5-10]MDY8136159.1 M1 family aminopeptidase [Aquimarina sp. 2201CG5-10]
MFIKLLQFELAYHKKQLVYYVLLILFFVIGASMYVDLNTGGINDNAPYKLNFIICGLSLGSIFPVLFFTIQSLLRDTTYKYDAIIYSTAITKTKYYLSKFIGVYISSLMVVSFGVLGLYLGQFMDHNIRMGDFSIWHYLWPWLLFIVPNTFIIAGILFVTTLFSRSSVITYVTGVLLLVVFWITSFYINSPFTGGQVLSKPNILGVIAILDYFGLAAFAEQTQFWTPYEKNHEIIALSGSVLLNRLIWSIAGLFILGIGYRLFSFRKENIQTKKTEVSENTVTVQKYKSAYTSFNTFTSNLRAFYTQCSADTLGVFKSIPFVVLMLAWMTLIALGMFFMVEGSGEFGGRYPNTALLVSLISEPFYMLGVLIVILYCGELIWKPKSYKFNEILYSTPTPSYIFLLSKYMIIILIVFFMLTIGVLIGVIFQVIHSYIPTNFQHFLSIYYFAGVPVLLVAFFAVFMQVLIPNKYAAMAGTGIIIIFFKFLAPEFILEERLLRFLDFGRIYAYYSDMNGYGQYAKPFYISTIYWLALTILMIFFSIRWFNRGTTSSLKYIASSSSRSFSGIEKGVITSSIIIFLISGIYIYYNEHILDPIASHQKDEHWFNEQYERTFKKYESLSIPEIVEVKTKVDIFPQEKRYVIEANYKIKNTSDEVMKEVFVTTPKHFKILKIENSNLILKDSLLKSYMFQFKQKLHPGDTLGLHFVLEEKIQGFQTSRSIMNNSTYISHNRFDPLLGYVDLLEINDPEERKKRGLPAREKLPYNDPHLQDKGKFSTNSVQYETIVSTTQDQTAIASGELIKQWKEGDRNYFKYRTKTNVKKNMTYFSARYRKRDLSHNNIDIEMYYHAGHYHNIDYMAGIAGRTLDYMTKNYTPYQHNHLRIAEVSKGRSFGGQAMPGTISMNETAMYTKDIRNPEKGINVVARRTIHEVAHQWWGHQLTPKRVEGAHVISEALCKYTEAVVLEELYGKGMVRKLSDYTTRRYFSGRSYARSVEPPLYLSSRQPYLGYSKGYIVLNALREVLGEETINKALNQLLEANSGSSEATSMDLLNELYKVAPQKYHALIDDWMKRVIRYDLKIKKVNYVKRTDGKYEIIIEIEANRFEIQESGKEIAIDINEPIGIGLFNKHPDELKKGDDIIYFEKHLINTNQTTLKVIADKIPEYVGIDPFLTRPDENRIDNLKRF